MVDYPLFYSIMDKNPFTREVYMKKTLFIFMCASMLFSSMVFAQNVEDEAKEKNKKALEYTKYILKDGIMDKENAQKIYEISEYLTPEQRLYLYEDNESSAVGPFFLNMLVGFGIGSFVQGDKGFGHMQLWGDIAGYALAFSGIFTYIDALNDYEDDNDYEDKVMAGTALMTVGFLVAGTFNTINLIRPWFYANKKNKTLKRAMRVEERRWDFSVAPIIEPVGQQYGLMAKITF